MLRPGMDPAQYMSPGFSPACGKMRTTMLPRVIHPRLPPAENEGVIANTHIYKIGITDIWLYPQNTLVQLCRIFGPPDRPSVGHNAG